MTDTEKTTDIVPPNAEVPVVKITDADPVTEPTPIVAPPVLVEDEAEPVVASVGAADGDTA